jgi:hypothetical protein
MDPTDVGASKIGAASPYAASNNPYQQMGPLANVIAALKAGTGGAQNAMQQQQAAATPSPAAPQGGTPAPDFGQMGGQAVNHIANIAQVLGGSSPAFGGGNFFSGDAWGGSAALPLPGLDASDYG